jgi:tyrosyl-tRNA synthetase
MLLQANDFRHLCEHHDVELQMGGSDQWGNITLGIDFIRRRLGRSAHGLTWPLVTRSDGEKMGKSVSGAVWLDAARTSPYQFRQFWIQLPDADIESFLLRYSLRPVEDVRAVVATHQADPGRRLAQRALAHELTVLVHGDDAAEAAGAAADVLFGGDPTAASAAALQVVRDEVPSSAVPAGELDDLVSLLDRAGVASSKGEARRLLAQNGIRVNGQRADADTKVAELTPLHGRYLLLGRGRSTYHLVEIVP